MLIFLNSITNVFGQWPFSKTEEQRKQEIYTVVSEYLSERHDKAMAEDNSATVIAISKLSKIDIVDQVYEEEIMENTEYSDIYIKAKTHNAIWHKLMDELF